jgi:tetratricopeptide (TPR) repeat protein
MVVRGARLLAVLLAAASLRAQYTGSEACRSCHAARVEQQAKTGHAHALGRAPEGGPGEWAFGAGAKAITWVSQLDRDTWVEHGLTYYTATKSKGLTPGHDTPEDLRYRTFDAEATPLKCFRCHSTGLLRLGANYGIEPAEPGVHCESCHGPGGAHVEAHGAPGTILNPGRLSAGELNNFCGVCHRKAPESDWTDKWKTRHQPSYLAQAACFRASRGALTCLTCHDPHSPLSEASAPYDRRCAECHKSVRHTTPGASGGACVGCHMPQVEVSANLKFTNHWIGIYPKGGSRLVPARTAAKSAYPIPAGARKVDAPADPASLRPLFEQALADREKESPVDELKVARSAADLGLFLNQIGDWGAASEALRRAFEIDQRRHSPQAAEDAQSLAEILAGSGKGREAIELFRQAGTSATPATAARAFAALAALEPSHAEEHYRAAIDAEKRAAPVDSKRLAILLNNLAIAVEERKDYRSAESLFREALALQVKAIGSDSPAAGSTLSNLGSLLENAGRHDEAERTEREAIRIFERKLGPWSAELAASCANLADILWRKGDRASAASLYQRAISIDEAVYGPGNPEVAGDLVSYGTLLQESGEPAAAKKILLRAVAIYEKEGGSSSPEAARVRQLLR